MCGIAGFAGIGDQGLIGRMCDALAHRGPDDASSWTAPGTQITLGMRRLAIRDPGHGQQPMFSPDGRVALVFNGEIYNHAELRRQLEPQGFRFATHCDTEVVLAAYLAWNDGAWARLSGMFAIALVDLRAGGAVLKLCRDSLGIKPLYYHEGAGRLLFASEMKAVLEWEGVPRHIDQEAVANYLALRYVPGPGCLFSAIKKLAPGHVLAFQGGVTHMSQWRADHAAMFPTTRLRNHSEAVEAVGTALRQSVQRHLVADRPIGCFLSAGIDSMAVAGLMAEAGPLRTFSMGFEGYGRHELEGAAACARALGAEHTELVLGPDKMAELPSLVEALDEPIGDPIVVAMAELARHARRDVVVALSGDGADELFGGYLFQRKARQLDQWRHRFPGLIWPLAARVLSFTPPSALQWLFDYPDKLGRRGRDKLVRLLSAVPDASLETLSEKLRTLFDPEELQDIGFRGVVRCSPCPPDAGSGPAEDRLMRDVLGHWLSDDILMKLDKITMMHGLEGRVPFLDPQMVEIAARLAPALKSIPGGTKRVLRDAVRAQGMVPPSLIDAPKVPFYIPLRAYLDAPAMRDLIARTMDPARLARRGLVDPKRARALLDAPDGEGFLPLKQGISLVMLELWFERFCPDASWS